MTETTKPDWKQLGQDLAKLKLSSNSELTAMYGMLTMANHLGHTAPPIWLVCHASGRPISTMYPIEEKENEAHEAHKA